MGFSADNLGRWVAERTDIHVSIILRCTSPHCYFEGVTLTPLEWSFKGVIGELKSLRCVNCHFGVTMTLVEELLSFITPLGELYNPTWGDLTRFYPDQSTAQEAETDPQ